MAFSSQYPHLLFLQSTPSDFLLEYDLSLVSPDSKPVYRLPAITLILYVEGLGNPDNYSISLADTKYNTEQVVIWAAEQMKPGFLQMYVLSCISLPPYHHLTSPSVHLQSSVALHCSPKSSPGFQCFPHATLILLLNYTPAAHHSVSKPSHHTSSCLSCPLAIPCDIHASWQVQLSTA